MLGYAIALIVDFVAATADPLVPTNQKLKMSCRLWKWLCGSSCFSLSWICCSTGCTNCTLNLKKPQCCRCDSCHSSECSSCISCSVPKCNCWCSNPFSCRGFKNPCRGIYESCCTLKPPPCFDCCSCKCKCACLKNPTCSELCSCECNCRCACPKCPSCSGLCNWKCPSCSGLCNWKCPKCSDICNSCLGCVGCITNCCCCEECFICC
ncbi:unnamed protein product [Amaranthus hypochondriacus]